MVPLLLIRQFMEGLLGKNVLEFLVQLGHYVFEGHGKITPRGFSKFLGDGRQG